MPVPALYQGLPFATGSDFALVAREKLIPFLVDAWLRASSASCSDSVVAVSVEGFDYLFDVEHQRLIAAWGFSGGRHGGARDKSRMAGHPLSAGTLYHRGHAIPHTLGGGTDINLVPQLGRINVGPFRALEKRAVATPGSLYFTFWRYPRSAPGARGPTQTPSGVDQGFFAAGQPPEICRHGN
ncbi:MAG TPA: hypothetical protein VGM25_10840 [Caulobacteraceae bacterium]|jgi:hypothetical protein